jgi:hypothetical protein
MTLTEGGSHLTIEEYGDHLLVGDQEGGNPFEAMALWKRAEAYADEQGKDIIVTAETPKMAEFFVRMGLVPEHIVFRRKIGQDSTLQGTR